MYAHAHVHSGFYATQAMKLNLSLNFFLNFYMWRIKFINETCKKMIVPIFWILDTHDNIKQQGHSKFFACYGRV